MSASSYRLIPASQPEFQEASVADKANSFGVHDALRYGLRSVKTEVTMGHPLEKHLENYEQTQDNLKLTLARNTFGSHMPVRIQMERTLVSQPRRIPVLPSSNLGLDILKGKDDSIEFEDFLNTPENSTVQLDVHGSMEHRLGWKTV